MDEVLKVLGKFKTLERYSTSPYTPKILARAKEELQKQNYTEVFPMLMHLYTVEIDNKEIIQEVEEDVHVLFEDQSEGDKDFHLSINGEAAPLEMMDLLLKKIMDGRGLKEGLNEVLKYYDTEMGANILLTYFGTSHGFVYVDA